MVLCSYGCGQEGLYTTKQNKFMCEPIWTKCPAIRAKNSIGLKKAHNEGRKKYTPNPNRRNGRKGKIYTSNELIFCANSKYTTEFAKKRIIKQNLIEYQCAECGISTIWNNKKIVLELDHKNGIRNDHQLTNLQFLCPNCHSQTTNFKGRNRGKTTVISDEDLIEAYNNKGNIRQALITCNLTASGANYTRLQRLINQSVNTIVGV